MSAARDPKLPGARWVLPEDQQRDALEALALEPRANWLGSAWRRLWSQPASRACLVFLIAMGLASLLAPLWPLASPSAIALQREPAAPAWPWVEWGASDHQRQALDERNAWDQALATLRTSCFGSWRAGHWLGTDAKGRDLLARIVWGSRVSLQVALCAALCSLSIGLCWGLVAGYAGGRVDQLMMRTVDVLYSLPLLFLVIFLVSLLAAWRAELEAVGLDRLTLFYLVLGAVSWLSMARVVRGEVLRLRNAEFVLAARALGASAPRILFTHLLPNIAPIVIVYLTLTLPAVILFEAFLSFLGLGVEAPMVSWGLLASDCLEATSPLFVPWWLVLGPALAMGSTLLALNLLGDGLRDALDPRQESRRR